LEIKQPLRTDRITNAARQQIDPAIQNLLRWPRLPVVESRSSGRVLRKPQSSSNEVSHYLRGGLGAPSCGVFSACSTLRVF
jgi:hypothetical protein